MTLGDEGERRAVLLRVGLELQRGQPLDRRRHVVVQLDADDLLDARDVPDLAEPRVDLVEHDHDARAGVLDLVLELALGVERVVPHRHRADPLAGEERDHVLGAVGQDHAHAITLLHAEAGKDRREPLHLPEECRVVSPLANGGQRRDGRGSAQPRCAARHTAVPSDRARASAVHRVRRKRTRRDHRSWGASSRPARECLQAGQAMTSSPFARSDKLHRGFASDPEPPRDHQKPNVHIRSPKGEPSRCKNKSPLALSVTPSHVPVEFLLRPARLLDHRNVGPSRPEHSKAVFQLHAYSTTADKAYQFVVVGAPDNNELKVNGTKWGTNGTAGGPFAMLELTQALAPAMDASGQCSQSGFRLQFGDGRHVEGLMTPNKVADKGKVDTHDKVQTGVKVQPEERATPERASQENGSRQRQQQDHRHERTFFGSGFGLVNVYVRG